MARYTVSLLSVRRQRRSWALSAAFALLLTAVCYPPVRLKAEQPDQPTIPATHIAQNQQLIANASQLQLTPKQVGGLWSQVGSDYQDLADFDKSEDAYNRALRILESIESARDAYAITLGNLGSLYAMTGRYDAALNCHKRSLAVLEQLGDPLMTARGEGHLADAYLAMGKNKEAARYSLMALDSAMKLPQSTNDDKGSMLLTYAYASCLTSHFDDCLRAAREAMEIVRTTFAPDSFPAGQANVALGFAESRTGVDTAEQHLREGVRVLRMQLPPTHPLMVHALDLYRDYLAKNHRDAEAKQIAEEQKAIFEHGRDCANCTVSVYGLRGR